MSTFSYRFRVGNVQGGEPVEVEAMVDTGAYDTMLPASLLDGLGVQPLDTYVYVLADGRPIELRYSQAMLEINGIRRICTVVFGPADEFLLGATTLETFRLMVDPNSATLIPVGRLPLGGSSALLGRRH